MEIGMLNQRIAILEHRTKKDSIGNHKAWLEELFSCWANGADMLESLIKKELS